MCQRKIKYNYIITIISSLIECDVYISTGCSRSVNHCALISLRVALHSNLEITFELFAPNTGLQSKKNEHFITGRLCGLQWIYSITLALLWTVHLKSKLISCLICNIFCSH